MARVLVFGSSNTDMTVRLPRLPSPGQTVLGGSLLNGPGGKGANQAVAAARAGAEVVFVTAVGDDAFGQHALDTYRREGIDVSHTRTLRGVASGIALIFVGHEGENMIGVAPGANAWLGADDLDRLPEDLFRPQGVLLIAGLEIPLEAVSRAVQRGAEAGMRVVFNPAPALDGLAESGILRSVQVITPNRVELSQITQLSSEGEDDLAEAAGVLSRMGPAGVVVTLGSEGCLVLRGNDVRRVAARNVRAVDTVGAGDAFNGALAVALAEGRSLDEAAVWANAAGALAVTVPGAQSSLPTREAIDAFASSTVRFA